MRRTFLSDKTVLVGLFFAWNVSTKHGATHSQASKFVTTWKPPFAKMKHLARNYACC